MSNNLLNECNGCIIINNNQNIILPSIGKINSYTIDFEKPCFFINNHFLTPILRSYNVELPNPVTLEYCDKLRIKIKIPKQILGKKYGYSLDYLTNELKKNDFYAGLQLKSSDGCINISRCISNNNELEIEDFCGWICITIHYQVGENNNRICNLCQISYSLCFSPIKLRALYGVCEKNYEEVIDFISETCLELENVLAKKYINITEYISNYDNNEEYRIVGPDFFICLHLLNNNSNIIFDKFSKKLTISKTSFNINDFNNINNLLSTDNKFLIQYKNNSDIWEDFTGNINIDLSNEKILDTKFLKCNE